MAEALKILSLIVFSGLKIFLAPAAIVLSGYGFWETVIIASAGGILSFFIFFRFGRLLQRGFRKIFKIKAKKKFSKRNRWIVKVKASYGYWGLAFLTPCLWGIPIGAILASVFYPHRRGVTLIFGLFIVFWSVLLTSVTIYFKEL